jgi:dCTP deaminase
MSVLSAQSIRRRLVIIPFSEEKQAMGMSYGLSAASYDIRIGRFQAPNNTNKPLESAWLAPGGFEICSSLERVEIPNDVTGMVHDKSTLARKGMSVQNTFLDPGFKGWITLELHNASKTPIRLLRGMPIAQIVFHELDEPTELPYKGKYQDQPDRPVEGIMVEDAVEPKKPFSI